MDAAGLKFIHQLVAMGSGSLLQYVSESSPYSADPARVAVEAVRTIAREERDETARLTRLLQKMRLRPPKGGSYPSHFTTMNFVTLEYLLPKLIAEHEKEIAQIAAQASPLDDEAGRIAQAYLDMKRRHLQTLQKLATPIAA
jgi:hypothetical protein